MRQALIAAAAAIAAVAPDARADAKSEAEALFRAGQQAFASSRYGDAAQAFEQAYAKLPLPAIAFSTAQAHRLQYFIDHDPLHLQRAVELYHVYIDAQHAGGRVADATANLAEIEPLYMQLRASGAVTNSEPVVKRTTAIMVIADIAEARATIDGEVGATPMARDVEQGDHAVVVEADGYEPVKRSVTAVPNEMLPVEVHMVAKPARLTLHAPGGAHLSIDGRPAGDAPLPVLDVQAGKHLFAVTERGHVPFTRELELDRGATASIDAAMSATTQRVASRWVLVGSAVVAGGAVVTGIAALSADHSASALLQKLRMGNDSNPDDITSYNDLRDARDQRVTATEALGGAAVAIALTGLALYFFDQPMVGGHF